MSAQKIVNEGSSAFITVYWWDETPAAVTPTAATYKIDDASSGQVILVATAIPALATSNLLTITAAQNAILNPANKYEERRITVAFTYSAGTKNGTAEYVYAVHNLRGV